jgi:hypothetical protein
MLLVPLQFVLSMPPLPLCDGKVTTAPTPCEVVLLVPLLAKSLGSVLLASLLAKGLTFAALAPLLVE